MKNVLAISIWLFLSLSFLVNGQSCSENSQRVRLFVKVLSGCDSVSYVQILIDGSQIHQEEIPKLPIAGQWSERVTKIKPGERKICPLNLATPPDSPPPKLGSALPKTSSTIVTK